MLPIFSFNESDVILLHKYIQASVLANPLSNGRYDSFDVNYKYSTTIFDKDYESEEEIKPTVKPKVSVQEKQEKKKVVFEEDEEEELEEDEEEYEIKPTVKPKVSVQEKSTNQTKEVSIDTIIDFNETSDNEDSEFVKGKEGLYSYFRNSNNAFIRKSYLPNNLINYSVVNFNEMYQLHPENRHCIVMYGQDIVSERYSKSYLKTPSCTPELIEKHSYMYSGLDDSHNYNDLPEIFQPFYDYMKSVDSRYNQVVINWYDDGEDYLPYHSDCEKDMIDEYVVTTISFNDPNFDSYRSMTFIDSNNNIVKEVFLETGSIILMNHHANKIFKHGIAKSDKKNIGRRISMSFRQTIM
jgi:alkylated DNA repair dioxygenase AlkB